MPSYAETLEYLFARLPMFTRIGAAAFKKDLTNTIQLLASLDNPEEDLRCIHIAGTNGKGSTSHMLASVFQEAGYKTGLYTSPHLRDFRERIKINGEMISEQEVVNFTSLVKEKVEEVEPSFFELTVAMAFDHFKRHRVDVAIIETGMGGRLDSTNVIMPLLSVITNIGFDHMDFLGNTMELIAGEKAGIIKKNTPAVIGETHPLTEEVFRTKASLENASLTFADQRRKAVFVERNDSFQVYDVIENTKTQRYQIDLLGNYQEKNVLTVIESVARVRELGLYELPENAVQRGISKVKINTGLMGRWQMLGSNPRIFCDTGHNKDGIRYVLDMIASYSFKTLYMVIGMVKDKDISGVLKMLPNDAYYVFTQANIPRAMDAEELQKEASQYGLKGEAVASVPEALALAKQYAETNDFIFVGGSTFVVAEVV